MTTTHSHEERKAPQTEERREQMIETERLVLREYTMEDFDALYEILSDPETMRHYPRPYDAEMTRRWIQWNLENYQKYGFGLWAVTLKETGEFIGDCGLTMQLIDGETLPEIGYHIHKKYWRRGFGSEAARAVRDWAFTHTDFDTLYSYMKYTNTASYSTAIANGMVKVKEYPDEKNEISYAYAITRQRWKALKKSNVRVRLAVPEELPRVNELRRQVNELHVRGRPDIFRPGFCEELEQYLYQKAARGDYYVFVALLDGVICGFARVEYVEKPQSPYNNARRFCHVEEIGVDAAFRHRGVGSALLERIRQDAMDRGFDRIELDMWEFNTGALAFYEQAGFKTYRRYMELNVKE